MHTHDTAGTGVATVLAAFEAGADVADTAIDSFSGMTSQPSMGAVVHALEDTPLRTGIDTTLLADLNDYWCDTRMIYAPFESNLKSGSADVYYHEMPGGQYTNLLFQSCCLGLEVRTFLYLVIYLRRIVCVILFFEGSMGVSEEGLS